MIELWNHQKLAIERAREALFLALLFEPGLGKSRTTIEILRERYNRAKRIGRTVIFAPLSVCQGWKEEFGKFSKIPPDMIQVLTGDGKSRIKRLEQFPTGIVVTNYEAVTIAKFYEALVKWSPEMVIFDEIQRLKDATTVRSKKLIPLADKAQFRMGLTGTFILQSEMDIFGQMRALDRGANFGTNFYTFRKMHFFDRNVGMPKARYFPDWRVKESSRQYFANVIQKFCVQAKKSECLDLPPLQEIRIPIEMTPQQEALYAQMKRQLVVELDGKLTAAEFAMTKTLRLQQILCGFVVDDQSKEVAWVDDAPRIKALKDLLESLQGQKVIVWTNFTPTYSKIGKVCEELKLLHAFLTGEQNAKEKQESIDNFQKGNTQVLISNPAAGGVGINLQAAGYSIYFSRSWSLEHYLQSQARNYRAGSEIHEKVIHYHFIVNNTLDSEIMDALSRKEQIGKVLLDWAKKQEREV